jgi:hypothetical protein
MGWTGDGQVEVDGTEGSEELRKRGEEPYGAEDSQPGWRRRDGLPLEIMGDASVVAAGRRNRGSQHLWAGLRPRG